VTDKYSTHEDDQKGAPRKHSQSKRQPLRRSKRQVIVQETPTDSDNDHRLDRLAALLSDALSRQLGQVKSAGE
jgi:hypothetical protein